MKKTMLTKEIANEIGNRLNEAKTLSGLSGIQIAEKAEMSSAQISRMLNGKNANMTISTIYNLAEVLGVDPAWLAFGVGEPTKKKSKKKKVAASA